MARSLGGANGHGRGMRPDELLLEQPVHCARLAKRVAHPSTQARWPGAERHDVIEESACTAEGALNGVRRAHLVCPHQARERA